METFDVPATPATTVYRFTLDELHEDFYPWDARGDWVLCRKRDGARFVRWEHDAPTSPWTRHVCFVAAPQEAAL